MIATLNPVVAPLAMIYTLNDGLISRALDGLSDDELWRRPLSQSNPMLWIVGHVVQVRTRVLEMTGDGLDTGWGNLFGRGVPLQARSKYPTRGEIETVRRAVADRLSAQLAATTEGALAAPASGPQVPGAKTRADQIAFFALHDSYHVGQLAYVRKALGHSGVAG